MPIESTCTDVIDLCSDDDETHNPKRPVENGLGPSLPFSAQLKLDEQERLKFQGEWFSKQEHSKPPQVGEACCPHSVSGNRPQCRAYDAFPQKPGLFNNRADVLDGRASYVAQDSQTIPHNNLMCSSPFPSTSSASIHQKQMCRRFWKAGDYNVQCKINSSPSGGLDHVRVHPKFLHSNATSHKWALGAVAELLDNALDEARNGATYVRVDALKDPTNGSPMLLVQDDGGGMDPDCMRECMSLGYSRKTTKTTIGQYGNGFKTSTMRLGADVVVFSRSILDGRVSESIGLLSYTFLHETGKEDIVVPMIDFEIPFGGMRKVLLRGSRDDWLHNLSIILQWSPYKTQEALLNQFSEIGCHGTRIIVYNLWLNDDGELELDFDNDKKDIQLRGGCKHTRAESLQKQMTNQHISNRLRYSLRAYSSVLYLHLPENFQIILRGEVVQHLSIAEDLKFPECILYKPHVNYKDFGGKEVSVITTIGFAKEAPMVNVHGFNVYHKNRLIMPFWKVFHENSSRGKGVVGVLEANFMEPAHDKQDFERTPILQRLEARLKQMTIEYWNLHCELIGYQPPNKQMSVKPTTTSIASSRFSTDQQLGRNHAEAFLHAPITSETSAEFAGAAPNGSQFSQSNKGQSFTVSPFLPPHSALSNASGHVSSFLHPVSKEAHGASSYVHLGGASNVVIDVKPCPSVLNSVTLNQLHPVINIYADARTVCEENGLINTVQKSSLGNFSSSTKSASFPASAPSTPPQPGSDIGLLCKQVDTISDDTSNSFRVASAYDCADGHVWAQSTSSEKSTTTGKRNQDDQEVVFSKRLATQVKESVPISEENAATLNGSSTTPVKAELLEEVKQLRLRCSHYEWEKRQLQLKIYELQLALAQMQQKENVFGKDVISISKNEL